MTIALHNQIEQELKKHKIECKFTFINGEKKSARIVVVCIFRLDKPYRDDESYINGLLDLVYVVSQKLRDHHVRIYYDDSVYLKNDKWKSRFDKLEKSIYVELIHYDFPQFKEVNGYHKGLFGTIVRLLCLFNFDKSIQHITLMDLDYSKQQFVKFIYVYMDQYKLMNKHNMQILLCGYDPSYILTSGRLLLEPLITNYNCDLRILMIPTILRNYRFDRFIIINFLKCLLAECNQYTDWIQDIKLFTKKKYVYDPTASVYENGGNPILNKSRKSRSKTRQSKMRHSKTRRSKTRHSKTRRSDLDLPNHRQVSHQNKFRSYSVNIGGLSRIKDLRVMYYYGGNDNSTQIYERSETITIPYGIDEFFMNRFLLNDIIKHKIKFVISYQHLPMASVNYIVHFLYYNKVISEQYTSSFYKHVLKEKYQSDQNKNYEIADKILFKKQVGSIEPYGSRIFEYLQRHNIMDVVSTNESPLYLKLISMFFDRLKIPYAKLQKQTAKKELYQVLYVNNRYEYKLLN